MTTTTRSWPEGVDSSDLLVQMTDLLEEVCDAMGTALVDLWVALEGVHELDARADRDGSHK